MLQPVPALAQAHLVLVPAPRLDPLRPPLFADVERLLVVSEHFVGFGDVGKVLVVGHHVLLVVRGKRARDGDAAVGKVKMLVGGDVRPRRRFDVSEG